MLNLDLNSITSVTRTTINGVNLWLVATQASSRATPGQCNFYWEARVLKKFCGSFRCSDGTVLKFSFCEDGSFCPSRKTRDVIVGNESYRDEFSSFVGKRIVFALDLRENAYLSTVSH
jgi:hypothetical protein